MEEAAHHDPAARKREPIAMLDQEYPASEKGGSGPQAQQPAAEARKAEGAS